jgi:acyl-CoA synthetase (AMP-forming)/AMP-acid ligase II/NAD(P)-dependent dehydrogenase (short-subunit alcohol dehydrogenase family)
MTTGIAELGSAPDTTLSEFVLAQAPDRGTKPALVDALSGRALSYAGLAAEVRALAEGLAANGVQPGDVLALCAPNSIEFAVALYAATSAGAAVATVNPQWTSEEIARQLRSTGARWMVSTPGPAQQKARAAARGTAVAAAFSMRHGAVVLESPDPPAGPPPVMTGLALLLTSSGTTGLPKNVMLPHRALVANLGQIRHAQKVTADDVVIAALPLFHIFALQVSLNLALLQGATVVILPRFELGTFLQAIQDHRVTRAEVVPPMLLALAARPEVGDYDLSSLRLITSAAAPLGGDLARDCAARVGCRIKQAYGMTEAGGTHVAPDDGPDRPDSVGPPLPGVECRIVTPGTAADAEPGLPGELLVRSPATMAGYLDNPAETAAAVDPDGWLRTGDIVSAGPDGWYSITDRAKELIKYKGYQVAPAELEALLVRHPAVADAAVVRSPDPAAGEVPKAFVVRRAPVTQAALMAWVAERVAPYKRIRRVEFTDAIPKSPTGKILRRVLIERDTAARAAPGAKELSGTVVLVTGAGRGLGRVLAARLARAGASVGLLARSADELAATAGLIARDGGTAAIAVTDVTDQDATAIALKQLREQLGAATVLVNNAGVTGPMGPMWDVDADQWWRAIEINLGGAVTVARLALPGMTTAGQGRIINVTSNAGIYRWPLVSAYAASKAALVKLTETLAEETRGHGVAVFSVDPGILPIGFGELALSSTAGPATAEGRVAGWVRGQLAAGRGTDPDRAADLVLALASGRADRLSGRHLTPADNPDAMLADIERIEREDLHTLRLRR